MVHCVCLYCSRLKVVRSNAFVECAELLAKITFTRSSTITSSMCDALQEATKATEVSLESIEAAAARIKSHIHTTPILTSGLLNEYLNRTHKSNTSFLFKAENLQKTGSFKIRGALNALSRLQASLDTPVVTHSSGNHAAALAAAARVHSRSAHIVIPTTAPEGKVVATECYGGVITRCGPTYSERVKSAEETCDRIGGILIHPFLNPHVVSGQGTVGIEIISQVPDVDAIVVPIGGGGLIAGVTIAVKSLRPGVKVIGAEPRLANAAARSLEKGERVLDDGAARTVADGVKSGIGTLGWEVVRRLVDCVVVVEEEEIMEAMKMVWSRMKVVVEGAAGVSVAAGRSVAAMGFKNVVVVLCGGNVEFTSLPWL